jgi:hypothetical protein
MEADKVLGPAPLRPFYYGLPSKKTHLTKLQNSSN